MALTFLSDLLPYDQYLRTGYIEQLTYAVNILNAASGGTIRLESENTTGTKKHEAFFQDFGTMERRDITTDSAQVAEKIERAEHTAFKTFWKFKPVAWQWTAFKTSDNMTNDEVMFMVGRKLAEKKVEFTVKQAITICAAAIGSRTNCVVDAGSQNFSMATEIDAMARFGDAASRLRALIMHSAVFFTLFKDQVLNTKFTLGEGLMMYGGTPATMNKPVIVTDNPELTYQDGDATKYKTLFLTDNAVTLRDNGNTQFAMQTQVGNENLASLFQGEGDMWNYVKGYQLKSTAGTNPTDSALSNSSNWEMWVNTEKLTAGVLIKSKAALDEVSQVTNVRIVS